MKYNRIISLSILLFFYVNSFSMLRDFARTWSEALRELPEFRHMHGLDNIQDRIDDHESNNVKLNDKFVPNFLLIFERQTETQKGVVYTHTSELEKPKSQMQIGQYIDKNGEISFLLPADDPLRENNSFHVALNTYAAIVYKDKQAEQRLCKLVSEGAPLNADFRILTIANLSPGFLRIQRTDKNKQKTIFDFFHRTTPHTQRKEDNYYLLHDGIHPALHEINDTIEDILLLVAQARDERSTTLKQRLTTYNIPDDLIALIQSFDENSPEELAEIQNQREKISQKRKVEENTRQAYTCK